MLVMHLGIEIGGTKLQLAAGDGQTAQIEELVRLNVDPEPGAAGILGQIEQAGSELLKRHNISRAGIGFGGPVDPARGMVRKSHQIEGWENMPLVQWLQEKLNLPAVLGNDCDCAALAEARFGAGQGSSSTFFLTVGTGVGGGFVVDGKLHGAGRPAVAEIGHLRPRLDAELPDMTVESLASGPGIVAAARHLLDRAVDTDTSHAADLLDRCGGNSTLLTAKQIGQAAAEGNHVAQAALEQAVRTLGWAIAQAITLLAPEVVVVGGGVSLLGEELFFSPLRKFVQRYVFPPLLDSYEIHPAALGETVVVHGALALASGT